MKKLIKNSSYARERVGIVTLGCARNLVDSENILSGVRAQGGLVVPVDKATTILINTCAFTKEAKQESIDVILDFIALKKKGRIKKVYVYGCLTQRYRSELADSFKEVDGFFGVTGFKSFFDNKTRLTPAHLGYVKISEGCANQCSFCAIPLIKGPLASRSVASILGEVKFLEDAGVQELNIIGQDITLFGMEDKQNRSGVLPLVVLLKKILKTTRIPWVRLLYLHPKRVCDELIDVIADEKRICSYIDLPLQHINDRILMLMHRGIRKAAIEDLIQKLRRRIPHVALRTSMIVGFPSESDGEFNELLDFVKKVNFARLGAFKYSREEGTKAYHFKWQLSEAVKQRRYDALMSVQKEISSRLLEQKRDTRIAVMVDEPKAMARDIFIGRTQQDASDVDGLVYLKSKKKLKPGSIVQARVVDTYEYDVVAQALGDGGV